ncbi:TetR/AcrR family transcriptional regulator [Mycobacterium sp. 1081908.1]|uniref:TetR/AcrR family transcriptional regulator n=1 Tax=Mycobacterium sp. 1081908.1 TaxID=1834066 RepID=UPI0008021221|nr:TetR/AcrR family transcriptional regulator [Mycobacterium sp. 1081908.1]OBK43155.1 TetR family transcriptional regulator [Mycobacterium sp. 1081908.1]
MARRGGSDEDRRARGDRTRRDLIAAGRALFVDPGFLKTTIGELVSRSGVGTRGAFYHHFDNKAELFHAVFREVEQDLMLRSLADPPSGRSAWEYLVTGLRGFLDAALEPEVQRIILIDGPVILGWQTLRAIQDAGSIAMIEVLVRRAISEGSIEPQPVHELTHMMVAALEEAALLVAHSSDPGAARASAGEVLDRLLRGLTSSPMRSLR